MLATRWFSSGWAVFLIIASLLGCEGETAEKNPGESEADSDNKPSNRIAAPPVVRRNLGITFEAAEFRAVASTVLLPGHFEVLPSAQHHYPMPLRGRVTVRVAPLDRVQEGQLLLEIDAPDWRALQLELVEATAGELIADAKLAQARAARLAAGSLTAEISTDEEGIPDVYRAEIQAAEATVTAARDRFQHLLARAATLTGSTVDQLKTLKDGEPLWRRMPRVPIRAVASGVVREVEAATGTWVSEDTEVVHVVQSQSLRFRARALQADLIDRIRDGQIASIMPPEGRGAARRKQSLRGRVRIGVTGDPDTRTTDVFIDFDEGAVAAHGNWAMPQLVALAEVVVAGSDERLELAIPARAVIQDGLERVMFRRDPNDPDVVIRTKADLGLSNGRWVTVLSGLAEGHEVVVDGIYQLKLATTGQKKSKAGHFHSDGTFHEGED